MTPFKAEQVDLSPVPGLIEKAFAEGGELNRIYGPPPKDLIPEIIEEVIALLKCIPFDPSEDAEASISYEVEDLRNPVEFIAVFIVSKLLEMRLKMEDSPLVISGADTYFNTGIDQYGRPLRPLPLVIKSGYSFH